MKLALAGYGVLGLLVMMGPAAVRNPEAGPSDNIAAPSWLSLPDMEYVTSVEYTGLMGSESSAGTIVMDLPGDGDGEIDWLKTHFSAAGFQIEDKTTGLDAYVGATEFLTATEAATGRSIHVSRIVRIDGTLLRITFDDPIASAQLAGF